MAELSSRQRALAAAVGLIALIALGAWARSHLDLELHPEGLRDFVRDTGALGPIVFIGLVGFRAVLGVPSQLPLVVGGLAFGTVAGTLYGTIGIALSGTWIFFLARWMGSEALHQRIPRRVLDTLEHSGSRAGAWLIGLGTAYPVGPVSAYHGAAGLVRAMPFAVFLLALVAGAAVRSLLYAFFGSSLVEGDSSTLVIAGACIAAGLAVPLVFRPSRRWVYRFLWGSGEPEVQPVVVDSSAEGPPRAD